MAGTKNNELTGRGQTKKYGFRSSTLTGMVMPTAYNDTVNMTPKSRLQNQCLYFQAAGIAILVGDPRKIYPIRYYASNHYPEQIRKID